MSKYISSFDTLAGYNESVRPEDNSSVSEIAGTRVIFDGINTIVSTPDYADAVVYDSNNNVRFVKKGTINLAQLTASGYTPVGVVAKRYENGDVLIVHKENTSKQWAPVFRWEITGSALTDNTSHTGELKFGSVASASFTWQTSTIEDFASALNTFVASNHPSNVGYSCYVDSLEGNKVILQQDDYASHIAVSLAGTTVSAFVGTEIPANSNARKINGKGSEGGVMNLERAKVYFRSDLAAGTYNPTTSAAASSSNYPICLPGYLGTSANVTGDPCAFLRDIYGEGEEGWINYLKNYQTVKMPSFQDVLGGHATNSAGTMFDLGDGFELSYALAGKTYRNTSNERVAMYPAVEYAIAKGYNNVKGLEKGKWFLPSLAQLYDIISPVTYPVPNASRTLADDLNRTLVAIGGNAVSNGSYAWSASRYNTSGAWSFSGNYGNANGYNFYGSVVALGCLLYRPETQAA